MRGRQFGFLALLAGFWCAGRIMTAQSVPAPQQAPKPKTVAAQSPSTTTPQQLHRATPTPSPERIARSAGHRLPVTPISALSPISAHIIPPSTALVTAQATTPWQGPATSFAPTAPSGNTQVEQPRVLHVYGYSFFRKASASGLTAPGAQYGGSQSGFVATWDIVPPRRGRDRSRIALLVRGAIAHGKTPDRELSAGVRWQPLPHLPVSLSVERRFRPTRADANAAYLAGGTSLALPRAFRMDAYAQAGIVSGSAAGPFFDFSARADRKFVQYRTSTARAGAGLWGGGQSGVFRIDVGPTVRTDIAIARTNLRLSADWRIRIAGDAAPASGPAMTLSTSF